MRYTLLAIMLLCVACDQGCPPGEYNSYGNCISDEDTDIDTECPPGEYNSYGNCISDEDTDIDTEFDSDGCVPYSACAMGLMYLNRVNLCPDYVDAEGMPCVVCVGCILVSPEFDAPCDAEWKAVGYVTGR